ncbi:MAG: class I SAM-dependent methyltransferase, partial [bacterium]
MRKLISVFVLAVLAVSCLAQELKSEDIYKKVKEIKNIYYSKQQITLLRCLFDKALHKFSTGSIDLLHIDGLHTYEAVRHDFESWVGKLTKDGVIMFHDIAEKKDDFGVYK